MDNKLEQNYRRNSATKIWLDEVSFMRPVLLALLVAYHAFCPYVTSVSSWSLPDGFHEVDSYNWIGLLSRAFRLEGFVFISGYIFTFQLVEKRKFTSLRSLLVSKFQRLLIPGFIFSALYLLFFPRHLSPVAMVAKVIGGAGHLWYLPCLFWCFLMQYVVIAKEYGPKMMAALLFVAMALSVVPLPLQLNRAFYYMAFFYGGGVFGNPRNRLAAGVQNETWLSRGSYSYFCL